MSAHEPAFFIEPSSSSKRSFGQISEDSEYPEASGSASSSSDTRHGRNGRNSRKRARSDSPERGDAIQVQQDLSGSASFTASPNAVAISVFPTAPLPVLSSPSLLPLPIPDVTPLSPTPEPVISPVDNTERLRRSLERSNAFDDYISVLRRGRDQASPAPPSESTQSNEVGERSRFLAEHIEQYHQMEATRPVDPTRPHRRPAEARGVAVQHGISTPYTYTTPYQSFHLSPSSTSSSFPFRRSNNTAISSSDNNSNDNRPSPLRPFPYPTPNQTSPGVPDPTPVDVTSPTYDIDIPLNILNPFGADADSDIEDLTHFVPPSTQSNNRLPPGRNHPSPIPSSRHYAMDPAGDRGFSQRDDLWNDNLERWAAAASRRDSQDRWDDRERIERDWSAGLESHTNTNERRGFQSRRGPANVPSAPREPPRFYNKAPPIQHSPVYPVVPNFSGFPASPAQRETDQDSYQHDHVMSERGPWIRIVDDDDALFERANRRTGRNGRNEFMPPNHSASGRPALPLSSNGGRREPLSVERMFSDVNADIVDGILNRNDIEREGLGSPQVRNSLSYRNPPSSSSSNSSRASNGSQSSAYFSASSSPYPSTGPTSFYPFSLNTYSPGVSRYHTAVSNFNVPERSDPPASFSVAERSQNEVPRQATSGREVELVLQSFQDVLGNIGRPEPSTSSGQTGTDGNTSLPSSTRARDASNPLELERHLRQIEQADESSHNRRYNLSPNAIADDLEEILPDNALSSPHPDLDEDVTMDRAIRASIQAAEGLAAEFSNAGVPEISPELRQLLRTVQNHTYSLSQTSRRTPSRGPSRHERPVPEVEHRAPGPYEHLPSALRPSPVAVDFRIENGRVVEAHRFNPLTDTTGPPVDALTYLRNRQQALRDGRALQAQLRDGRPQGQNPASVSTMEGWRPPSPPPAPTPPSHSARSSQYPNLNLNDFHDGPFRASMARTMALNRRRAMGQAIAGNRPPPSHSLASRPNRDSERAQPSSRPSRPPYAIPPRNYLDSRSSSRPTPSIGTERDRPPVLRDLDFYNPGTGDNGTSRRRASFSREQPQVSSQYSRDQRELHDFVTRRRPVATLALQVNEPNSRHEDLPLSFTRRGDRDRNDVYRRRNNDGRSSDSWGNIAGDISMGSPDMSVVSSRPLDPVPTPAIRGPPPRLRHQPAHGSRSNRGWGRDSPPLIPTGPPPFSYARHADARPVNGALPPHLQAGTTMQSPHNRARLQADINTELERSREDRLTRVRRHAHARELSRIIGSNDLESAYEGLVRFTAIMEEGGTRRVPQAVIDSLPSGVYSDWATPGESEDCCPICLDDYEQDAPVLRVPACKHWFHKTCLTQWLKRGDTCPVCRAAVRPEQGNGPPTRGFPPVPGPSSSRGGRRFDSDDDEDDFFLPLDLF